MSNQYQDLNNKFKNLTLKYDAMELKLNGVEQGLIGNTMEICGVPKKENENLQAFAASLA